MEEKYEDKNFKKIRQLCRQELNSYKKKFIIFSPFVLNIRTSLHFRTCGYFRQTFFLAEAL